MIMEVKLEDVLELVDFELVDGRLQIAEIHGDILGNVWGNVRGSVWGNVAGDIKGDVFGKVCGSRNYVDCKS